MIIRPISIGARERDYLLEAGMESRVNEREQRFAKAVQKEKTSTFIAH